MTKALTSSLREAALWAIQGFSLPLETAGCSETWCYAATQQGCAQVKSGLLSGSHLAPPTLRHSQAPRRKVPGWAQSSAMTSAARQTAQCPQYHRQEWNENERRMGRTGRERDEKLGEEEEGKEKGDFREIGQEWPKDQKTSSSYHWFPNFLSATTVYFTFSNDGQHSLYFDQVTQ